MSTTQNKRAAIADQLDPGAPSMIVSISDHGIELVPANLPTWLYATDLIDRAPLGAWESE